MASYQLDKRVHPDFGIPGNQPSEDIVIDWSNPLARGLIFAATQGGKDVVSGVPGQPVASNSGVGAGLKGKAFESNDLSDGGYKWPASGNLQKLAGQTKGTILTFAEIDSANTWATVVGIPDALNSWSNPFHAFSLIRMSGSTSARMNSATSSGAATPDSATGFFDFDGSYHMYGVVIDGTTTCRFYKDGTEHSTGTNANLTANMTMPTTNVHLMSRNNAAIAEGMNGRNYIACYWNRDLSANEVASFNRDPYQIFKPAIPMMYFVGGDAPPVGVQPTYFYNLLLAGAR